MEHSKPYAKRLKYRNFTASRTIRLPPAIFDSLSFKRQKFFQAPYNKVNVTFFHNFLLHETPKFCLRFFDSMLI